MAAIAATTGRIRVGSAGVMLPHYSSLKVAEVFRVLEARGARADRHGPGPCAGLGRADRLSRSTRWPTAPPTTFPSQVRDLLHWVRGQELVEGHPFRGVHGAAGRADRAGALDPGQLRLWGAGRRLFRPAILLCGVHHRWARRGGGAGRLPRPATGPAPSSRRPYAALCVWAMAADTRGGGGAAVRCRARSGGWGATAASTRRCPARRRPRRTPLHRGASGSGCGGSAQPGHRRHRAASGGPACRAGGGARGGRDRHPDHAA